jgi:hypothetical protein
MIASNSENRIMQESTLAAYSRFENHISPFFAVEGHDIDIP